MDTADAALAHLASLAKRWAPAKERFEKLDAEVTDAIADALRLGARPTDVEKVSPLSHATTRKRARAAGIEPGTPGGRPARASSAE
jgi:hypothetical protein